MARVRPRHERLLAGRMTREAWLARYVQRTEEKGHSIDMSLFGEALETEAALVAVEKFTALAKEYPMIKQHLV